MGLFNNPVLTYSDKASFSKGWRLRFDGHVGIAKPTYFADVQQLSSRYWTVIAVSENAHFQTRTRGAVASLHKATFDSTSQKLGTCATQGKVVTHQEKSHVCTASLGNMAIIHIPSPKTAHPV